MNQVQTVCVDSAQKIVALAIVRCRQAHIRYIFPYLRRTLCAGLAHRAASPPTARVLHPNVEGANSRSCLRRTR